MRTVKYRQASLLLLAWLWTLPGWSQATTDNNRLLIGFAQDTLASEWRRAQARELEREFSQYPHVKLMVTDAKGRTAKQVSDIEDLIRQGIDILIASPRDRYALTPVIATVYQRGIPVILLTRDIATPDYTTLIGADDSAIATDAAQFLVKTLQGKGRVLMLQGLPSASTAITRSKAFTDELKQHSDIAVSTSLVGNYRASDTLKVMDRALREGVEFDAIYAQSDAMASGARMALEREGYDVRNIPIVGIDYISEGREAIRQGLQTASFTYPTGAKAAAQAAMTIARGRIVPRRIVIPSTLVTLDNIEEIEPAL